MLGCRYVLAPRRVLAALATPAVTRHARAAASRRAVFAVDPHRRQRRRHAFAVLVDERGELAQLGGLLEASPGGRPASQFAKSDWSSRNWVSGTVDRSRARNSASPMSGSSRTAPSFRAPAVVRRACARTPAACIHSPGCPSKPWGAGGRRVGFRLIVIWFVLFVGVEDPESVIATAAKVYADGNPKPKKPRKPSVKKKATKKAPKAKAARPTPASELGKESAK